MSRCASHAGSWYSDDGKLMINYKLVLKVCWFFEISILIEDKV